MVDKPIREIDRAIVDALKAFSLGTPAFVAKTIKRDRRYVANRLSYLVSEGLVEKVVRGVYRTIK